MCGKALTKVVGAFSIPEGDSMQLHHPCRWLLCHVDAFALDGEQLWFISVLGSQQSMCALWAQLVKAETACLSEGDLGVGASEQLG
jgi:hypothetical protein